MRGKVGGNPARRSPAPRQIRPVKPRRWGRYARPAINTAGAAMSTLFIGSSTFLAGSGIKASGWRWSRHPGPLTSRTLAGELDTTPPGSGTATRVGTCLPRDHQRRTSPSTTAPGPGDSRPARVRRGKSGRSLCRVGLRFAVDFHVLRQVTYQGKATRGIDQLTFIVREGEDRDEPVMGDPVIGIGVIC